MKMQILVIRSKNLTIL